MRQAIRTETHVFVFVSYNYDQKYIINSAFLSILTVYQISALLIMTLNIQFPVNYDCQNFFLAYNSDLKHCNFLFSPNID